LKGNNLMTIERVFNENSNINLIDIINSLIAENIDNCIEEYYNSKQVNFATSYNEEGDI
jgi:hypothetical protein